MDSENIKNKAKTTPIYTNRVSIAVGIYDFTLRFGLQSDDEIDEQARIIMSPQHAKTLLQMLSESIEDYENSVAPIVNDVIEEEDEEEQSSDLKVN